MMTPAHCDKSPLKEITLGTKEEGMPISINIIAYLECSCHIWVPQLVYFDNILTKKCFALPFFTLFPNAQNAHFVVLGHI
jgi:hypothetical protein